ncbi:3'-5' exoribonuclease YhaM family protein [Weissella soli]|jgi:3'-5' exoribonuclease|uniref:3'-5' exoribonuclease n=1 Tax=Weissella soli TaxID=155866 RepID=A0A288QBV2_9LACO|nr:HD domain-containing protein [Weissella soli]AOT56742.1 3'-5' exoribonuclease YhaM [Weissella soli]NKY83194.1 HD domain-containing protein [Weissella soli]RDL12304.1 3'-5' exoribonuclease [Weissella soli]GEN92450.1 3'-5' exoribonuclease YhaM [Weissella soli]GJM48594.1 3'-5' exoribonuclease YhaM [Weissella soli]
MAEQRLLKEYKVDERIDAFLLLKDIDARVTNQGKPYLSITVADRSMEIKGNKWDATDEEIKQLKAGMVVAITAVRQVYQDKPQLKVLSIRPTQLGEPNDPTDYMVAAPMRAKDMEEEVNALLFQIINPTWVRIVRALLQKYHEEFYRFPAAKSNHHAFTGGLAYHSLSIARLANSVANQYPDLNRSLLLAGALLHDLGKVLELTGPIATKYTTAGNLLGHIVLIDEQIVLMAQELKMDLFSEDMVVLRHVVLAHHGLLEYGSPVRPAILEANILHQLDELDASMQSFSNALADTEPGTFSNRQFALDNRSVYHPKSQE